MYSPSRCVEQYVHDDDDDDDDYDDDYDDENESFRAAALIAADQNSWLLRNDQHSQNPAQRNYPLIMTKR